MRSTRATWAKVGARMRFSWAVSLLFSSFTATAGEGRGSPSILAKVPPLFKCKGDADWWAFRKLLAAHAQAGFPEDDDDEVIDAAKQLLLVHESDLQPSPSAIYGLSPSMQAFFRRCNLDPGSQDMDVGLAAMVTGCLYGVVAALWVIARSQTDVKARNTMLNHAAFLLGSSMHYTMDMSDSARWAITSLDIFANLDSVDSGFLMPSEVRARYQPPPRASSFEASVAAALGDSWKAPASGRSQTLTLVVWELGVHASLSAEPLQSWARLSPRLSIRHRNLIRDQYPQWLPDKCDTLYHHPRLKCDDVNDDINELFASYIPDSATSSDPIEIVGLITSFSVLARGRMRGVDIFLCTIASLCPVLVGLGPPIVGYFGHPPLFLNPRDNMGKEYFWRRFAEIADMSSVAFSVSDPFLQMQYEYQTGIWLPAIRTLALYTNTIHYPSRISEVLVADRPHECVLMCTLQQFMDSFHAPAMEPHQPWRELSERPWKEGRLRVAESAKYPLRFVTRQMTDRKYSTFSQFRAVVLWPYDMDLVSFYEFYAMNLPMFMPADMTKYIFHQHHMNYDGRWSDADASRGSIGSWDLSWGTPFNESSLGVLRHLLRYTDYFRYPSVMHFHGMGDLLLRLLDTDYARVVKEMAAFNAELKVECLTLGEHCCCRSACGRCKTFE